MLISLKGKLLPFKNAMANRVDADEKDLPSCQFLHCLQKNPSWPTFLLTTIIEVSIIIPLYTGYPLAGILANSKEPDENAA